MFSSPLARSRKDGKEISVPRRDTSTIDDPIEEFQYLLDRLGCLIDISKDAYEESLKEPTTEKSSLGFFRRTRKKDKDNEKDDENTGSNEKPLTPQAVSSRSMPGAKEEIEKEALSTPPTIGSRSSKIKEDAAFLPIAEEDECVEIIRRVAELVIIGERVVATKMEREDKKQKEQKKQGWGTNITEDSEELHAKAERELEPGSEAYIGIFDLFFERNGLGTIVDILTGGIFQQTPAPDAATQFPTRSDSTNPSEGAAEQAKKKDDVDAEETQANSTAAGDNPNGEVRVEATEGAKGGETENGTEDETEKGERAEPKLLPSLKVAIQAVQSVSILVQNVSRATSLYFMLSNNFINALIDLPLHLYAAAERQKVAGSGSAPAPRVKTLNTPELQEFTTHFVTFLKSLAMRMNTETLQFYLKYPAHAADHANEETRARAIEFPLYARALDFCAAHHDTFVRVTAMNICLNTLRLTTVAPSEDDEDGAKPDALGSSPDGVLHNASPLPFRERLAIATHTCAPSRVGRLASPIFTKLSTLWCSLQEKFLDLDSPLQSEEETGGSKKPQPSDLARERERRHNAFKDAAATIQDQLLLLDDLLKVGLTALNEQIIEMMLATFVYPLLLQPLLVYYQRLPSESGEAPAVQDPFAKRVLGRSTVDFNEIGRSPPEVTAPAKSALFTLAAVFHLISNRPLIRLLYTALFHPLSPDASGETVISAEGCVTQVNDSGKRSIRVDEPYNKGSDERTSYPFGGKEQVFSDIDRDVESCVFVLSPALAEVLLFGGDTKNGSTLANTRRNPYRRAILQCLEVPHHMSDFRKLSVNTVDAAISCFDGKFLVDTLFGKDLAKAGSNNSDQRNYMNEVVSALCEGLVNGKPGPFGTWKLQYDQVAAHALLCAAWKCPEALETASKIVEERYRKAAALVSEIPARIPTTQHLGSIMNLVFYEAASKKRKATFSDLYYMKNTSPLRFSTGIASSSSFRSLCSRSFEAPPTPVLLNKFNEHTAMDLGSSSCRAILKLDAFQTFVKAVAEANSSLIQDANPFGFALTSDRGLVDTKGCLIDDLTRSIHSYLSPAFCAALTDAGDAATSEGPSRGSIVALAGRTAMPCVCEAPASTVSANESGTKMVVEGITWQSLYLVFFGAHLVLAEPATGSAGSGRVVTSCPLSRVTVARDPNPPADPNSPARRLLMAYKWFDTENPSLFVNDEKPKVEGYGPFNKTRLWRSKLDVWFEDSGSAAHAYHSIQFQIDKAKTLRGDRILDYLTQLQSSR